MYLSPSHWISLAAGAVGVIGTIVLFRGSFAFESMPYWTDAKTTAAAVARNLRRQRRQRIGLFFILASFALQAVAQFFD